MSTENIAKYRPATDRIFTIGSASRRWLGIYADNIYLYGSTGKIKNIDEHLKVESVASGKTVKINSRDFTETSGDVIGFQSKPNVSVGGTTTVYGAQISPRFADDIAGGDLVGLQADCILKGNAGNLSGDVRAFQGQITDENLAGRTISGTVSCFWAWNQLAAHTITGGVYVLHVTAAGGATAWSGLAKLPDDGGNIADLASATATINAVVKIKVGSTVSYLAGYATYTPT
jgi:hypothetical protein